MLSSEKRALLDEDNHSECTRVLNDSSYEQTSWKSESCPKRSRTLAYWYCADRTFAPFHRSGLLVRPSGTRNLPPVNTGSECLGTAFFSLRILLLLEAICQVSKQQLAQRLSIDRANMVALLYVLEPREFIERQADPLDRRRHVVKLTTGGQEKLQQIRRAREEVDEAFLAGLDNGEQETLHQLLVKLFISLTDLSSTRKLYFS
jgi:DNA-binding MarR family transcriptional regulator